MLDKTYFRLHLFFSLLLSIQTSLYANVSTYSKSNSCDNLLTTNRLKLSEIDSAFTTISYFPDQDATKTHHSNHYPFPPESPRNDNILHILKGTIRLDHKKHWTQGKTYIEYYSVHSPPINQPPGNCSKPHYSRPVTIEVLRI